MNDDKKIMYNSKKSYNYEIGNFFIEEDKPKLSSCEQKIVDDFHNLYFNSLEKKSGLQISWMGVQTGKLPSDLWIYQELISSLKPEVIIECGTHHGGSAFYLAHICQILDSGRVISIDLYPKPNKPKHKLLDYLEGSSTDTNIVEKVRAMVDGSKNVMVLLDSNHTKKHVLEEINCYKDFVSKGGYIIVEDSFLNGHPSHHEFGEGPMEAIEEFVKNDSDFEIDSSLERFLFTLNRSGFLKKVK